MFSFILFFLFATITVLAFEIKDYAKRKIVRNNVSTITAKTLPYDDAYQELIWEKYERKLSKPVLNLSNLKEEQISLLVGSDNLETRSDVIEELPLLQVWNQTKIGLSFMGLTFDARDSSNEWEITDDENKFLAGAPQLLRLDSTIVLETASQLFKTMGKERAIEMIKQEPRLLACRSTHLSYGFEFLSNMMGIKMDSSNIMPSNYILSLCYNKPKILLAGIDGGIQEQLVKKTLGDAGSAISDVNKRVVGDAATLISKRKEV